MREFLPAVRFVSVFVFVCLPSSPSSPAAMNQTDTVQLQPHHFARCVQVPRSATLMEAQAALRRALRLNTFQLTSVWIGDVQLNAQQQSATAQPFLLAAPGEKLLCTFNPPDGRKMLCTFDSF